MLLASAHAAEIRGKVVNSRGGEPLGRVQVSVPETRASVITAPDGTFAVKDLSPGTYTLRIDAVGFWLQKITVLIAGPEDVKEYSIALVAEGLPRTETVEVKGDIFRTVEPAGVDQMNVTAGELKSTATLLSSDPFRTVQVLPGVSSASNNDFFSEFTVLGAPFSTIGIYVDDVQLRNPVQGIPGFNDSASVSAFSSDTIESMTLTATAFSERYADGTGAALDIRTREGSRTRPQFRVSLGLLETHGTAEGGFAHKRGTWLVSARKSYMGYIMRHTGIANAPSVGFYNGEAKLTYDLTNRHTLDFYVLDANVSLDRTSERNVQLGPNSLTFGDNTISLARLGWRFAVSPTLVLSTRAAFIREALQTRNPARQPISRTYYGEWVGGTTAVWSWKPDHTLEAGYDLRRLRDNNTFLDYLSDPPGGLYGSDSDGAGFRHGGYVQQTSTLFHKRLHLLGGLRWDHLTYVGVQPLSPQASASFRVARATEVQFGFGRYLQFRDLRGLGSGFASMPPKQVCMSFAALFDRSTQYLAAVEQRLGEHSRIRLEAFDHENSTIWGERVIVLGPDQTFHGCGNTFHPFADSSTLTPSDYSRGFQLVLQRRSANRLAGWIGYTLDYARVIYKAADNGTNCLPCSPNGKFPSFLDQRHTLNGFASYRLKPTMSLSGKLMYGSGYPIPTWLSQVGSEFFVPNEPSFVRMPPYARLDLRVDKTFAVKARKLTFSAELLNATNHYNLRYLGYDSFDPSTNRVHIVLDRALSIAPTFGLSFEF
jgi:hypothetical protein